jgi:hypothetical protein
MTDPKNIVIKVKYTSPEAATDPSAPTVRMVTEWNIKRIAGALIVLTVLIAALFFLLIDKSEQAASTHARNETAPNTTPPSKPAPVKAEPQPAALPAAPTAAADFRKEAAVSPSSPVPAAAANTKSSGRIRRAALAYRIVDKEPADLIEGSVAIGKENPVLLYYFTEVRDNKAQILFHEWAKNGQTVLRHPVAIAAERWRTSSQRHMGSDDLGNWTVRTADNNGTLMNEIHFTVSAK